LTTTDMNKIIKTSTSSFEAMRKQNTVYVDKTEYLYNLIQIEGGYFFLSRPRRFGKSLTLSTLKAIFEGRKELFDGLYIGQTNYEFKKHPVIHIDFGSCQRDNKEGTADWINYELSVIGRGYGIELDSKYHDANLKNLIIQLYEQHGPVVILIDEYDKPLSDSIDNVQRAVEIRDVLRGFYEVIKSSASYLRFVFITGVTKYSKMSIFSSMNNLNDISIDSRYSTMLGYTQEELEHYFDEGIDEGSKALKLTRSEYLSKIKRTYDGYCFAPNSQTVYNPVSVGRFFDEGGEVFRPYWIDTGGQKLLYETAKKIDFDIEADIEKAFDLSDLSSYDIVELVGENVSKKSYNSLLYQSGYLTIKSSFEEDIAEFDFPNEEVRKAFSKILLPLYIGEKNEFKGAYALVYLREGKIDEFISTVKSVFAFIPSNIKSKYESAYQIGFCCMMRSIGAQIRAEEPTNKGRIDAVIETRKYVYIIEFKVNSTADVAIKQIQDKGYAEKYKAVEYQDKTVVLLGINFDTDKNNVTDYKAVTL
ncbi:MAG: AAA family ATPase, partial [Sphaerochaetaceae bacterium]|nr:AAA family ATPase [Sphaerochaetaceae bacterium]